MKKKIIITGGGGYIGSRLVPILIKKKFNVTVYDQFYFGNYLTKHKNLKIIKGDIRDTKKIFNCSLGNDIFLHLACVSNDASFQLKPELSKEINFDCFEPMVIAAKLAGIKKFIYASTSSVYGISKKKNVTENHKLLPITLYNKYKAECEPLLLKHSSKKFCTSIFRPATVCGYSPRQRLDLSVNILTNYAFNKRYIKVFGGKQLRPNLHILDYCRVVLKLINSPPKKINKKIFNVGNQNMSIMEIAQIVKKEVENKLKTKIEIVKTSSDDKRSYHINSDKIKKELKFYPKYNISNAVQEICNAFQKNKILKPFSKDEYYNVKTLLKKGIS
jgi:nucleoside-diphosphate-sugar epimerase